MNLHLADPLTSLAFSNGKRQNKRRTGVFVSFLRLGFRRLLLLSSWEIKNNTLYEIFINLIPISAQRMTTETPHQ